MASGRRTNEFTDRKGVRVAVGDTVRATYPNEWVGEGVVVALVKDRALKPFVVAVRGRMQYFNREWTEVTA